MMGRAETLLKVEDIHTYYGNIHALRGVSLEVNKGEIVTLIGSNGAGKSTMLNTICGILKCREGAIYLQNKPIQNNRPHTIVRQGLCQVPEGRKIFTRLSVAENLEMGAFLRNDPGQIKKDMDEIFQVFPRLKERRNQVAGTLSGGEQQMLAIGRALMARPAILLLDEPSMGLAPIFVETIFDTVADINKKGTTILLVEQNALMAFQIAARGYVIQTGVIVLEDTAQNLAANDMVKELYLGGDTE
jgi:branched-chain amino acid transport system ATP-binding protein